MSKQRKFENIQDAERCLGSLKVLFNIMNPQDSAIIGLLDFLEKSPPDLYMFLDAKSSGIVAVYNEIVIVKYELDGELIFAEIPMIKIQSYSKIIGEFIEEDLKRRSN